MSSHAYSEGQLVEQPAIGLFAALGWQTVSALEDRFHPKTQFQHALKALISVKLSPMISAK